VTPQVAKATFTAAVVGTILGAGWGAYTVHGLDATAAVALMLLLLWCFVLGLGWAAADIWADSRDQEGQEPRRTGV
jgi:hypothetical protein